MRCLMCGKEIGSSGNFSELLLEEDVLCHACRRRWIHRPGHTDLNGIRVDYDWDYDSDFSKCLIQYKECGDEALKEVFLYPLRKKLKRRYRGYTLVLMPSSHEKLEARGFVHLEGIFEGLGLPMLDPFEKCILEDQKQLNLKGRQAMAHGIRLKRDQALPKRIVLVDDVMTTGSTLRGALSVLDQSRYRIRIYTCAIVTKEKPVPEQGRKTGLFQ